MRAWLRLFSVDDTEPSLAPFPVLRTRSRRSVPMPVFRRNPMNEAADLTILFRVLRRAPRA